MRTWRAWPFACAASLVASHHLASAIATPWWRRCPIARRADASAAARATPYCRHVVSARTSAPRVTRDTVRVALWRRVFAAAAYSLKVLYAATTDDLRSLVPTERRPARMVV